MGSPDGYPRPAERQAYAVMLVTGAEKAEAVHAVFHEECDPKRYSAQMVSRHGPKGQVVPEQGRRAPDGPGLK